MRTFASFGLLALCFVLSGAEAAPRAEAAPETNASAATAASAVFALPDVRLSHSSPEARSVAALAAGDEKQARRIIQSALPTAHEPSLGRLRYLYARATPDIAEARVPLEALAKSTNALAGWARLSLTERLREHDPSAAVPWAESLMTMPRFRVRGEQLLALSLYSAGRYDEAEPMLRSLVADVREKSSAMAWAMPLASILSNKFDTASQQEALALYRRVISRAPLTNSADQARVLATRLLEKFSPEARKALSLPNADDAFAEAESLFSARQYARAASGFAALAARFQGDATIVCDAQLGQGKAMVSANKKPEALQLFEQIAHSCQGVEVRADAHFQAGRVLLRRGEPSAALEEYDTVAREFPTSKLADDALLAAASTLQDLGDTAGARARLTQLLKIAPYGDVRPDARFLLAWLERADHHYDAALAQFAQLTADGVGETSEDIIGRSSYWHARTLLDSGDRAGAVAGFTQLINAHPFTYYAQQALARLDEVDHKAASAWLASVRDTDGQQRAVRLTMRPELRSVEFERAIELLRVGEPTPAVEELDAAGYFKPAAPDELYLLGAALLQEFGADAPATQLARRRVTRVMSHVPKGPEFALWRVVFPCAYRPLIDDIAHQAGVPPAFVRAIAREESSFDPTAVSPANAYGLIQLIRSTARAYAKPLKLKSDPESLKRPEVNLRIGVSFMRDLFDKYKQNLALVPSAYNAGSGATDRWLRQRGNLALDEWIETIPYTETRRYTRRVLQSYGAYAWLDEGRLPPLVRTLPKP